MGSKILAIVLLPIVFLFHQLLIGTPWYVAFGVAYVTFLVFLLWALVWFLLFEVVAKLIRQVAQVRARKKK